MQQKLADILEVFTDTNKTVVMLLLLTLGTIFRLTGYIDGQQLVEMLKTTTVAFFGTTAATHFSTILGKSIQSKLSNTTSTGSQNASKT